MTQADPSSVEPRYPLPPRYWWLKRIGACVILLIVVLSLVRFWWGWEANRRFDRAITELRARGEPIWAEEFDGDDVDDDYNAATYLLLAATSINPNAPAPSSTNMTYRHYPPYPRRWHRAADQAVAGNAKALDLARQARSFDKINWGIRPQTPAFNTLLPSLNQMRNLANLLGDAAMHAHLQGDDALALERIRDLLFLADAVDRQPFIVSHLVSIGIDSLTLGRLEIIASAIKIAPARSSTTGALTGPATREQVQTIMELLLSEDAGASLTRTLRSERMLLLDSTKWLSQGNRAVAPMFQLDMLRVIRDHEHVTRAATQPTWAAADAVLASLPGRAAPGAPPRLSSIVSTRLTPPYRRFLQTDMRVRMERQLAAAALAVQLYRADHGDWPLSLEPLVPSYLPFLPRDPFAMDDSIKFFLIPKGLPDGSPRPLVYSVGEDGIDDTAAGAAPNPAPSFSWFPADKDQWRDLVRWQPAPSSTDERDDDSDPTADPTSVPSTSSS